MIWWFVWWHLRLTFLRYSSNCVADCFKNVSIRRFKTRTSRTTWTARRARQVFMLHCFKHRLWNGWIIWCVCFSCEAHQFFISNFNHLFCFLGYGRPGPKGDKGDAGFASSSGMIQNLVCIVWTWFDIMNSNILTWLLFQEGFTMDHQDHQDHLGFQGLKDHKVIRLFEDLLLYNSLKTRPFGFRNTLS